MLYFLMQHVVLDPVLEVLDKGHIAVAGHYQVGR